MLVKIDKTLSSKRTLIVLGKSLKFGWANFFQISAGPILTGPFMAGPIFSTFWLGQSLAAGPVLAGPSDWAIFWLGQFCWTGIMAGSSIGPAKNLAQP